MGMQVNSSRGNNTARGVELFGATGFDATAHKGNPAILDGKICPVLRDTRSVHNGATANDHIIC
jgi:hypothetical protein